MHSPAENPSVQHVAVLTELTHIAGRRTVEGVLKYAQEKTNWIIESPPHPVDSNISRWLGDWRGDGIVLRSFSPAIVDQVKKIGIPVVNTLGSLHDRTARERNIRPANEGIGRKAATYFLEKGFHRFAFLGMKDQLWSKSRKFGFRSVLKERSLRPKVLEIPNFYAPDTKLSWTEVEARMTSWAKSLPEFCGVFCVNDDLGCYFIDLCRKANRRIPSELAILGVDNDAFRCELCNPSLSSIDPNHREVGYQAAALLDRLMHHRSPEVPVRYVSCGDVVERGSTDVLAVCDEDLKNAVSFIRDNLASRIRIEDIARHAHLSQSVLKRRFKTVLGQTVHERIVQERIRVARTLLVATNLPLVIVAERSGFAHQGHMGRTFREHLETTPLEYRHLHRHEY